MAGKGAQIEEQGQAVTISYGTSPHVVASISIYACRTSFPMVVCSESIRAHLSIYVAGMGVVDGVQAPAPVSAPHIGSACVGCLERQAFGSMPLSFVN